MILSVGWCAVLLLGANVTITDMSSGADRFDFTFRMSPPALSAVVRDGDRYVRLTSDQARYGEREGWPMLPVYRWLVALPPGAEPRVSVRWWPESVRSDVLVWPRPRLEEFTGDDGLPYYREVFMRDPAGYSAAGPLPDDPVRSGRLGVAGGVELGYIELCPFRYHPQERRLVWYAEAVVEVAFLGAAAGEPRPLRGAASRVLDASVLNPDWLDAFSRRGSARTPAAPRSASDYCKVYTLGEGLYRVRGQDLAGAGVSLSEIDVSTLRLDGPLGSLGLQGHGLDDALFGTDDWVQFYAPEPPLELMRYDDRTCTWLGWGGEAGASVGTRDVEPGGSVVTVVRDQPVMVHWEEEHERIEYEVSLRGYRWGWALVSADKNKPSDAAVGLRFLSYAGARPVTWRVLLKGKTTGVHHAQLTVNGDALSDTTWLGTGDLLVVTQTGTSMLRKGTNQFKLTLPADMGEKVDQVFLDWVEADFCCSEAAADTLRFLGEPSSGSGRYRFVVDGFNSSDVHLWDVTDSLAPVALTGGQVSQGGSEWSLMFEDSLVAGSTKRYLARGEDSPGLPLEVERYESSGILDGPGAQFVVVTHHDFSGEAGRLASFREQRGLASRVVETWDIYDEMSWGLQSPEAIRAFVSHAYHSWETPPEYILLLGDGSNDYKDYYETGDPNWVPPYMDSTYAWASGLPSDNWYVAVDGADYLPDLAIGRLPARSTSEADIMVNKITSYESAPELGLWRSRALYVADDGYPDQGSIGFAADAEEIMEATLPGRISPRRVYVSYNGAGNASGESMNRARDKARAYYKPWLRQEISDGCLLSTYVGHGGKEVWTSEWIFGSNDMEYLTNGSRLPWMRAYSCHNGWFDDPLFHRVISEMALRQQGGGAVAYWASTRGTGSPGNKSLAIALDSAIFEDHLLVLGDATLAAKLQVGEEGIKQYMLFGDPAMTLGLPPGTADVSWRVQSPGVIAQQGDTIGVELTADGSGAAWVQIEDASGVSVLEKNLGAGSGIWTLDGVELPLAMPNGDATVRGYAWGDGWEAGGWTSLPVARWSDTLLVTPEAGSDGPRCNAKGTLLVEVPPGAVVDTTYLHIVTGVVHTLTYQHLLDPAPVPSKPEGWVYAPRFLNGQTSVPAGADVRVELSYDPGWMLGADVDSLRVCYWDAGYSRWRGIPSELKESRHVVATTVTQFGGAEYGLYVVYDGTGPSTGPWYLSDIEEPAVSGDFLHEGDHLEISIADVEGIDPGTVAVTLDGSVVTESLSVELAEPDLDEGAIRWVVPGLRPGYHQVRVSASDFYGNESSDILGFLASAGLEVAQVMPHPSPFTDETHFTYLLSQDADDVFVDVYTVSGALVTRIADAPSAQGFNSVPWNGRDQDGDSIANGVYLYRLKARANGRTVTTLGTVVKMG
jgi:hypothetical protein